MRWNGMGLVVDVYMNSLPWWAQFRLWLVSLRYTPSFFDIFANSHLPRVATGREVIADRRILHLPFLSSGSFLSDKFWDVIGSDAFQESFSKVRFYCLPWELFMCVCKQFSQTLISCFAFFILLRSTQLVSIQLSQKLDRFMYGIAVAVKNSSFIRGNNHDERACVGWESNHMFHLNLLYRR